jgi:hypothetical protein
MSTTDESQNVDAGWEDDEPGEAEVDEAWDSVPVPLSAPISSSMSAAPPSVAAATEEVDGGWDDAPVGAPSKDGKRRPHRQRRAKSAAIAPAANPVLLPRPAEPTKKHQREHARQQRLHEAKAKQDRKAERKAERAAEAREQAAERLRQTEAEERARKMRRDARERAVSERPAPKPANPAKLSQKSGSKKLAARSAEAKDKPPESARSHKKSGLRPGVIITLVVVAAALALLLLRK